MFSSFQICVFREMPSVTEAILKCKCPRCRRGDMFTNSPFSLRFGRRANIHCPVCHLRFEREPGFYEGGMYFNYALNVAIMVNGGIATYFLLGNPNQWAYIGIASALVLLFASITSRLSKSLMLHLFGGVEFEKETFPEA